MACCRVVTSFSGKAHNPAASRGSGSEINGLLREINDLWKRRGVGEHKRSVSASKLRQTWTPAAALTGRSHTETHERPAFPATSTHLPLGSVAIEDPPAFTDIACTLQELEEELFKLSAKESAVGEPENCVDTDMQKAGYECDERDKNTVSSVRCSQDPQPETMDFAPMESPAEPCVFAAVRHYEKLSCWVDAEDVPASNNAVTVHVLKSANRAFTLELRERPRCARAMTLAIGQALNEVEAATELSEGLVVVFRSAPGIPFFTPLRSELELSYLTRAELLREKERLFCRMREARLHGVLFRAELNESALDFGAELFFMCDRKIVLESKVSGSAITVGFPSIALGVWPAPCVLQRISRFLGYNERVGLVVPILHTFSWSELNETHPGLLQSDRSLHWLKKKAYKLFRLQWNWLCYLLGWGTNFSSKGNHKDILMHRWDDYCALLDTTEGDADAVLAAEAASRGINMYVTLLGTTDFCNTASVTMALRRMRSRVLNPLTQRSIIEVRPTNMNEIKVGEAFCVFAEASSHATVRFITEHRSFSGNDVIRSALLMGGDAASVKDATDLLDCAVVATPLRPFKLPSLGEGDMVEVQLLCAPHVSESQQWETLSSALAYLQSREVPYIVTRGDAGARLVAVLALELSRLATEAEVQLIEAVAMEELRFRIGPFQLLDHYGMAHIANVMRRHSHLMDERRVPAIASRVLSAMEVEGFGGESSRRGGFYTRYGDLNLEVATEFVVRRKLSRSDICLRLLFALVNESCRMLLDGCVEAVDVINLVSIGALTLHPSTGGLLSYLDGGVGCVTLLRNMNYMSREMGATAPPSPLLQVMLEADETFCTLSPETLYEARQRCVGNT
ncbi:3-hydroxyacyl-CoA dehydrogenase [Trypanosoma rangeli]|uniref:3-hydroxyacyl-CoA dehydrogenase n=1 Tax=Trypanosoma rangeli TaxID=5698 RepID=A0A3R7MH33_TRYRA|nr:3-hydroxyacyl-CoA dehydrogenase [Trypanosoma rangeli]RNF02394.1 3-hydroxyacyl-CoA dehydrogenase [Trypanosoma rangeli]|eukprot:RNF02394.1 3-hydroxyacyl-CoA dehydrogenase [Trypanosoma rangeli]